MAEVKKVGGTIVAVGVVTILLGVLSIAAPLVTGLAVTILVGAAILVAGIAAAVGAWKGRSFGRGIGDFLWGVLYAVVGVLVLAHPLVGLSFLTLLLAFFFFLTGAWKAMVAWRVRPRAGWGLVMTSAVVSLILGVMILASWPMSGAWAVGVLVGVELLFDGWTLVTVGATLREVGKAAAAGA